MKNISIFLILTIISIINLDSQTCQWIKQNANDGSNDIHFIDSTMGWMATYNGIYKSTNGGKSFFPPNDSIIGMAYSVYFIDSLNGWAGGRAKGNNPNDKIFRTTDGGYSWLSDSVGNQQGVVTNLFFLNKTLGWAIYNINIILKTSDGGKNWSEVYNNNKIHPVRVFFPDSLHGWAACRSGLIWTNDGGKSWNVMDSSNNPWYSTQYNDIYFLDSLRGWAAASAYEFIFKTIDGGKHWATVHYKTHPPLLGVRSIYFVDSLNGWAACSDNDMNKVLNTTDGGNNWDEQPTGIIFNPNNNNLYKVFFTDIQHGWIGGEKVFLRYSCYEDDVSENNNQEDSFNQIYPNPVGEKVNIELNISRPCHISLEILNNFGQSVLSPINEFADAGIYSRQFDLSGIAPGLYFVVVRAGKELYVQKFVKY
jgi:photosystem II stability/assembly factor-like uncharacterized protein